MLHKFLHFVVDYFRLVRKSENLYLGRCIRVVRNEENLYLDNSEEIPMRGDLRRSRRTMCNDTVERKNSSVQFVYY